MRTSQVVLPVVCAPDCQVAALLGYEAGRVAQLLHVAKQGLAEFVYVGRQGLQGGMHGDEGVSEYEPGGDMVGDEGFKLERLLQAAGDSDRNVRDAAISALGQLVGVAPSLAPAILEGLLQAAGDSDWNLREAAVSALGDLVRAAPILAPDILQPLLQAAGDSDSEVREPTVSALGQLAVAPSLATLEPLLQAAGVQTGSFAMLSSRRSENYP